MFTKHWHAESCRSAMPTTSPSTLAIVQANQSALKSGGIIRGVVRDAANNPIRDAAAMIASGPAHHDIAALTDASGSFDFGDMAPGQYTLQARGDARSSERIALTVRPAKVTFVQIALEADLAEEDPATGEPDDANGDPLPRLSDAEPSDFADEIS